MLKLEDLKLKDTRVLIRLDLNVPLKNGRVTDDFRIRAALPTVNYCLSQGASVVIMSHLGRPGGEYREELSLISVGETLADLLETQVKFTDDCVSEDAISVSKELRPGEIHLLENLRFHKGEKRNDERFSMKLASHGELYVNDAFGTAHRAHASTAGVTGFIPESAIGYLIRKELQFLGGAVMNPARPFTAILGGAKVSDKIKVIDKLLNKVQTLIIGGGMSCTFLKAQGYKIGASLLEEDSLDFAKELIQKAEEKGVKLLLPVDAVIADSFDKSASTCSVSVEEGAPDGWLILDIGPKSAETFCDSVRKSGTVLWNGPMGVFEMGAFAQGTFAIAQCLAEVTDKGVVTIIGGGDSAAAIQQFGLSERITHVSTGGGASLEFLEGKELPGVSAIQQSK